MKRFVIERNLPGAGNLSAEELQAIAQTSCDVIGKIASACQWVQTYVTEDKIYCIHLAENEAAVREHAKLGGLPVNTITEVKAIIDPTIKINYNGRNRLFDLFFSVKIRQPLRLPGFR